MPAATRDRSATTSQPRVVMQGERAGRPCWLEFSRPGEILVATEISEVMEVLERVDRAAAEGSYAAGFVGYGAAPAFDPALAARRSPDLPLAWFGIFEQARELDDSLLDETVLDTPPLAEPLDWRPLISREQYLAQVETIHRHIAAGDTYQVNLTFPLEAALDGADPWRLFSQLCRRQRARLSGGRHFAFVDTGDWVLCSSSPELFFALDGEHIVCRPMKGTVGRGRTNAEDDIQARWLESSAKNRAENVMIVDMVRNDLGRIAQQDSVEVTALCDLERYPSLYQLTSTVEAITTARLPEIFTALFPCASITGAPKIRAARIIHDLEHHPRGVYTGAIGYLGPQRQARFNVAIRTVQIDRRRDRARYGTGSGIVWESTAEEEWLECRTKGLVLQPGPPEFELLETLLWSPEEGYRLLDRHLQRLTDSARYFDFEVDFGEVRAALEQEAARLGSGRHKVRMLVGRNGEVTVEGEPIDPTPGPWSVARASQPVDLHDPFLFHKTTHREVYDVHRRQHPEADEVLLWNENRELTESTVANLVLRLDNRLVTPPIEAGLLAGTLRQELLDSGEIEERRLALEDLDHASETFLINSVRGWIPVRLFESEGAVPDTAATDPAPAATGAGSAEVVKQPSPDRRMDS